MKKIILPFAFVAILILYANAQNESTGRSCSVVCLNDQWIPVSYNVNAKTAISLNSTGILSVHETLDVENRNLYKRTDFIDFKVGIFKKEFDTMISFSDDTYQKIDVKEVLKQCEKGDQIVILLIDKDRYSLPHYKIDII